MTPAKLDYGKDGYRPIAVGRIIGAIIASLAAAGTLYFGINAHRFHRVMRAQEAARPVFMTVDLSRPGVTELPAVVGQPTLHGLSYRLSATGPGRDWKASLEGLRGTLQILSPATGNVVVEAPLPGDGITVEPGAAPTVLIGYSGAVPPPGRYTARFTVDAPAPAMANVPTTLYAQNEFCAAETLADVMGKAITTIAAVVAFVTGSLTLRGVRREGWRTSGADRAAGPAVPDWPDLANNK